VISVAIVGHTKRIDMVDALRSKVDAQYVLMDDGSKGCFRNHLDAWSALSLSGANWGVCIEDDAVPVEGFREQLKAVLAVAPSPVVSLYIGTSRPRFIQGRLRATVDSNVDTCWLASEHMLHAVGIAVGRNYIPRMLRHLRKPPAVLLPIDRAIGHWVRSDPTVGYVSYAWPSILDHADQGSVIEVHPDGEPRGPVMYLDEGEAMPVLCPRVAWRFGQRSQWDSSVHVLG